MAVEESAQHLSGWSWLLGGVILTPVLLAIAFRAVVFLLNKRRCVFCQIVRGVIPARVEVRSQNVTVFHDIRPEGRFHLLAIPNSHVLDTIGDRRPHHTQILEEMRFIGIAAARRLDPHCQWDIYFTKPLFTTVSHIHLHLVALPRATLRAPWLRYLRLPVNHVLPPIDPDTIAPFFDSSPRADSMDSVSSSDDDDH
jgi:histidine triad (HIT) family protein